MAFGKDTDAKEATTSHDHTLVRQPPKQCLRSDTRMYIGFNNEVCNLKRECTSGSGQIEACWKAHRHHLSHKRIWRTSEGTTQHLGSKMVVRETKVRPSQIWHLNPGVWTVGMLDIPRGKSARYLLRCKKQHRNIRVSHVSFNTPAHCIRRRRRVRMLRVPLEAPAHCGRRHHQEKDETDHSSRRGVSV